MAKNKFYAVWIGKQTGVFSRWDDCRRSVEGFDGARYKGFPTKEEAELALAGSWEEYYSKQVSRKIAQKNIQMLPQSEQPVYPSLAVDAACSGNPGKMEYRGVDAQTGREIFHRGPFLEGTNNIGEFLAIVHGLAFLAQHGSKLPIYSDSMTAQAWIRKGKVGTKLARTANNSLLFELIERAEKWLKENRYENKILKWETDVWGEIPADFGRK